MRTFEHAKAVEHWVSGDAGIRGQECRAAAAELRRLAEVNAELLKVLSQSADLLDERCAGLGAYARSVVSKAKEQQ